MTFNMSLAKDKQNKPKFQQNKSQFIAQGRKEANNKTSQFQN